MDRQSDIHATIKYIFLFLQIIIWGQKDWYETMKLKFALMFFDSACPTRPSDTVTKYTIYPLSYWWKEFPNGLGSYLQLYPMSNKTWLKDALHFTFWDRIFARVRFYKSSFFIPSFRHQDSSSYCLVLATAKISTIWKNTPLDVYFLIFKSQDRAINRQCIIQPKRSHCPCDTFFKIS